MRKAALVFVIVTLFLSKSIILCNGDDPDTRRFSLSYFDIDIGYPSTVKPGDTATITVSATGKSSVYVQDLMVEILVPSPSGEMRSIYSISIVKDTSTYFGDRHSKAVQVTIPGDVLRSFMMATVVQNVRTYYYSYSYPYYYNRYWQHTNYNSYWWPMYYVTTSHYDSTENGIAALGYILATTPEYTQLKNEFYTLQTNYTRVSQENSALNARLDKMQSEYSALQNQNESLRSAVTFTGIILLVIVVTFVVVLILFFLNRQGKVVIKSPFPQWKEKS